MPVVVETPRFHLRDLRTFHGYRQVGIAWLQYGTAVGAVYFVAAPLLAGMIADLKWSLTVASAALLVRGVLAIGTNPLTGWAVSRFGIRPVVACGGIGTAVFTALTGMVTSPIQFILVFGVALSLADAFMGHIPTATVVQRWFLARRSSAMGVVHSGAGFGGLIFAPLMAVLIQAFGWRTALFVLAGIILVLALPAFALRNGPRDVGQWVDGVEGRVIPDSGTADDMGTPQQTVGEIARNPLFWMLFTLFGIESWALGVYAAYQVVYLEAIGVGALAASGALGLTGGVSAVSGLVLARISDRVSPYYVLISATSAMTVGSVLFIMARSEFLLYLFAIFFGVGYGLLVLTIPGAVSRYFGARDFSRAFGLGTVMVGLMGGLGPFVTGLLRDATGSFTIPIYLVTGLLAVSVLVAFVARPPSYALSFVDRVADGEPADPEAAQRRVNASNEPGGRA